MRICEDFDIHRFPFLCLDRLFQISAPSLLILSASTVGHLDSASLPPFPSLSAFPFSPSFLAFSFPSHTSWHPRLGNSSSVLLSPLSLFGRPAALLGSKPRLL